MPSDAEAMAGDLTASRIILDALRYEEKASTSFRAHIAFTLRQRFHRPGVSLIFAPIEVARDFSPPVDRGTIRGCLGTVTNFVVLPVVRPPPSWRKIPLNHSEMLHPVEQKVAHSFCYEIETCIAAYFTPGWLNRYASNWPDDLETKLMSNVLGCCDDHRGCRRVGMQKHNTCSNSVVCPLKTLTAPISLGGCNPKLRFQVLP